MPQINEMSWLSMSMFTYLTLMCLLLMYNYNILKVFKKNYYYKLNFFKIFK